MIWCNRLHAFSVYKSYYVLLPHTPSFVGKIRMKRKKSKKEACRSLPYFLIQPNALDLCSVSYVETKWMRRTVDDGFPDGSRQTKELRLVTRKIGFYFSVVLNCCIPHLFGMSNDRAFTSISWGSYWIVNNNYDFLFRMAWLSVKDQNSRQRKSEKYISHRWFRIVKWLKSVYSSLYSMKC